MKNKYLLFSAVLLSMAGESLAQTDQSCQENVPFCSNYYIGASFGLERQYTNLLANFLPRGIAGLGNTLRVGPVFPWFQNYYDNNSPVWGSNAPVTFLTFGYDHRMKNSYFVAGVFVSVGYSGAKSYVPYAMGVVNTSFALNGFPTPQPFVSPGIRFKSGFSANAGFRFGVTVGSLMPFVRIGWEGKRVQMRIIQRTIKDTVQVFKKGRAVNAPLVGMGLAFQVTKSFGVEGLIDWVLPGKLNFQPGNFVIWNPGTIYYPGDLKFGARMQFQRAMVSLKYCFPKSGS